MYSLHDYFQNDQLHSGLIYNAPNPFCGTVTINGTAIEPFEFHLRINYRVSLNFKQLSFYIKNTSKLVFLIKNILENIGDYKLVANGVSVTPIDRFLIVLKTVKKTLVFFTVSST